jgi:hypothetical protein
MQTHRQLGAREDTVVNGRLQCRLNDVMGSHRRDTCQEWGNLLVAGSAKQTKNGISEYEPTKSNTSQRRA